LFSASEIFSEFFSENSSLTHLSREAGQKSEIFSEFFSENSSLTHLSREAGQKLEIS
jgi:hypothetical protein